MADRIFESVRSFIKEGIVFCGSFRPNGSGAVDNTLNTGRGFTIVRTAAGLFDIDLDDGFNEIIGVLGDPGLALNALDFSSRAQWLVLDISAATKKLKLATTIAGVVAEDIASDADNRIHFALLLKNSSVTP